MLLQVLCFFRPLLDACLSEAEEKKISEVMENYKEKIIDYHRLRTRKSGNIKYIEFHMTVRSELTVKESHELTEMIENDIEAVLQNTSMNIHIEPA
jgi:divalent metal cation (Fe/Co/Zn/Cd) transporter